MNISLADAIQVANIISKLNSMNDPAAFPPKLSGNLAYLRPEAVQWYKLSKAEQQAFADAQISLPLQPITEADLPPVMPPDMYEALNPIAKEPFENKPSELAKLMEQQSEPETTD